MHAVSCKLAEHAEILLFWKNASRTERTSMAVRQCNLFEERDNSTRLIPLLTLKTLQRRAIKHYCEKAHDDSSGTEYMPERVQRSKLKYTTS